MKKQLQCYLTFLAILSFACIYGCGKPTVHTVEVKGKVTLDGKPLESGSIKFIAANGETPSGGGFITNGGSYVAQVPPGKKKVLVISHKVVGQVPEYEGVPNSPMQEKYIPITPRLYNAAHRTPLEADINDGIQENLDFKLVSNPPR